MTDKLKVGILGATGAVGQNYAILLENHPWFDVTYLAASPASAGKSFSEAVKEKWFMDRDIPGGLVSLVLGDASKPEQAVGKCDFVFSSYEGSKEDIQRTEEAYAALGIPVVSNNSAHRWTSDVPMIIPEINTDHINLIEAQRVNRGWKKGFIVTKPNCSIQSYMTPLEALKPHVGLPKKIVVATYQALSGAGYPGVPSLAIADNVIPFIPGEEEKTEREPLKIFGQRGEREIILSNLDIYATCTRVNVRHGHLVAVHAEYARELPNEILIQRIWNNFGSFLISELPSGPEHPIIYNGREDRPQPRIDKDAGKGMTVTVGRLKRYDDYTLRFVGLSHNTIRGAAGGAILTAELLKARGYL